MSVLLPPTQISSGSWFRSRSLFRNEAVAVYHDFFILTHP